MQKGLQSVNEGRRFAGFSQRTFDVVQYLHRIAAVVSGFSAHCTVLRPLFGEPLKQKSQVVVLSSFASDEGMMMRSFFLCSLAMLACGAAHGQDQYAPAAPPQNGVVGYWSTNAGSVLHIAPCGDHVCITVVTISKKAPGVIDALNPNPSLRNRPVCQMAIGTDFDLKDPDHAVNGLIYDPESGKTYKSVMTSDGNSLHLRGYVGFKMFGRTQTWQRTTAQYATCEGTTRR